MFNNVGLQEEYRWSIILGSKHAIKTCKTLYFNLKLKSTRLRETSDLYLYLKKF